MPAYEVAGALAPLDDSKRFQPVKGMHHRVPAQPALALERAYGWQAFPGPEHACLDLGAQVVDECLVQVHDMDPWVSEKRETAMYCTICYPR